jgi:hypothetical protein
MPALYTELHLYSIFTSLVEKLAQGCKVLSLSLQCNWIFKRSLHSSITPSVLGYVEKWEDWWVISLGVKFVPWSEAILYRVSWWSIQKFGRTMNARKTNKSRILVYSNKNIILSLPWRKLSSWINLSPCSWLITLRNGAILEVQYWSLLMANWALSSGHSPAGVGKPMNKPTNILFMSLLGDKLGG